VLTVGAPDATLAQDRTVVSLYHGSAGDGMGSEFVTAGDHYRWRAFGARTIRLRLPPKTEVCVRIENAHLTNYKYTLGRTVDTSTTKIPLDGLEFVTKQWQASNKDRDDPSPGPRRISASDSSRAQSGGSKRTAKTETDPLRARIHELEESIKTLKAKAAYDAAIATDSLANLIRPLEQDLAYAKQLVAESDAPEELSALGERGISRMAGWAWVRDTLSRFRRDEAGRWGDPKLVATLQSWIKALIAESPPDSLVLKALGGYAGAVAEGVARLKGTLGAAPTTTVCGSVGDGRTTLQVNIAKAREDSLLRRDIGSAVDATIVVDPIFSRPRVTLFPVAMGVLALPRVSEFYVEEGTLRERAGDRLDLRPGLVLGINVANFGTNDEVGLHIGAGFSSTPKLGDIRDLFIASILSFQDNLRIGIGVGGSKFTSNVKGFTVGRPFIGDIAQLGDLVEQKRTVALQLLFVFPGLSF